MYINFPFIRKMLNDRLIRAGWSAPLNTEDEIAVAKYLGKLTAFSATIFVFVALSFRFLINLLTSVLLSINSIHFRYRLFDFTFASIDGSKWSLASILLVFGSGFLFLTLSGIFLLNRFKNMHNVKWETRLIITWSAFLLANAIPAAMIAGCFSLNNFGVVFHWIVPNVVFRILMGIGALLMMALSRSYWVYLFLKAAPSSYFLTDDEPMATYVMHVFAKSWLYGFCILLLFNWPLRDIFWPVFFLSFGVIAMPLFARSAAYEDISIRKSDMKIVSSPRALYFVIGTLLFIRIAGTFFFVQL